VGPSHIIHPANYATDAAGTGAIQDPYGNQRDTFGDPIIDTADGAGNMGAVSVTIIAVLTIADTVITDTRTPTKFTMANANARINDKSLYA
jgi:hypothetical protein